MKIKKTFFTPSVSLTASHLPRLREARYCALLCFSYNYTKYIQ